MNYTLVIQQNNNGVASLNARDFQNAIDSFSIALRLLKKQQQCQHDDDNSSSLFCSDEKKEEVQCCVDDCMLLQDIDDKVNKACTTTAAVSTTTTFVYDHAIRIHPTAAAAVQDDDDGSVMIAPIVIFNLALAHQLMANHHCDNDESSWLLQKAQRLYEVAYKSQDSCENVLFQFAIINNMAVIDRQLLLLLDDDDDEESTFSSECFDYLVSLWMIFVDRGLTGHLGHVQGFLVNVQRTTSPGNTYSTFTLDTAAAA